MHEHERTLSNTPISITKTEWVCVNRNFICSLLWFYFAIFCYGMYWIGSRLYIFFIGQIWHLQVRNTIRTIIRQVKTMSWIPLFHWTIKLRTSNNTHPPSITCHFPSIIIPAIWMQGIPTNDPWRAVRLLEMRNCCWVRSTKKEYLANLQAIQFVFCSVCCVNWLY